MSDFTAISNSLFSRTVWLQNFWVMLLVSFGTNMIALFHKLRVINPIDQYVLGTLISTFISGPSSAYDLKSQWVSQ